jgi:hypothetical protein
MSLFRLASPGCLTNFCHGAFPFVPVMPPSALPASPAPSGKTKTLLPLRPAGFQKRWLFALWVSFDLPAWAGVLKPVMTGRTVNDRPWLPGHAERRLPSGFQSQDRFPLARRALYVSAGRHVSS